MAYFMKKINTSTGTVVIELDHIPAEPTTHQLSRYVQDLCRACEYSKGAVGSSCQLGFKMDNPNCSSWDPDTLSYFDAYAAFLAKEG